MTAVGIDVGSRNVKIALVQGEQLMAQLVVPSGIERKEVIEEALDRVLKEVDLSRDEMEKVGATGVGRAEVTFASEIEPEVVASARGAIKIFPSVRTVIDIGSEQAYAVKCDAQGKVLDFAQNEKCAAGAGSFIEAMARALEVGIEEMGELSLQSTQVIPMNVTCVIFAESEVISLIHAKTPKPDIARAIHEAIAHRVVSMVRKVGVEEDVILIGGMARNPGIIERVREHLGVNILVPPHPEVVAAFGVAI
jgi:benzoyl-CoA reductase subunit D